MDLAQVLLKQKIITPVQLKQWQEQSKKTGEFLEDIIESSGLVMPDALAQAQAQSKGAAFIDLIGKKIDQEVLALISKELALNYKMIAFNRDKDSLYVAMLNLQDLKAREAVAFIGRSHNLKIKYFSTTENSFKIAFQQYESLSQEVGEALTSAQKKFNKVLQDKETKIAGEKDKLKASDVLKSAPVAKMVSVILRHAVEGKASDIHIEPMSDKSRIRYRIDGKLHTSIALPIYIHASLVSRIKVMANLKIDETRKPQDGRIRVNINDRDVDFRVSVLPLSGHEKIVMRVLDTAGQAPLLKDLGFLFRNLEVIEHNTTKPHGMLLITGPTGSGKSMTLFSCLSILNKEEVNISTLEDPVEYKLAGVNQSQIRPEVDFTFANGLRSLLRQDPDIIMVGEIRDGETAELAIHAAMTGHLVLSTLHTNNAIGAIPRLMDMKVQPFLLSSTLNVLIAQRLVRKICDNCKKVVELNPGLKAELDDILKDIDHSVYKGYGLDPDDLTFYQGEGCNKCSNTGFKGRHAICELIEATKEMQELIVQGMKTEDVEAELKNQGFITMQQDGLLKAAKGITAVAEVLSVTKEDE